MCKLWPNTTGVLKSLTRSESKSFRTLAYTT